MDKRAQVKAALAAATTKTPNPNPLATTTTPAPAAPPEPEPVALSPEAADAARKERERQAKRALNAWRAKGKNSIRPTSVGLRYAEIEDRPDRQGRGRETECNHGLGPSAIPGRPTRRESASSRPPENRDQAGAGGD